MILALDTIDLEFKTEEACFAAVFAALNVSKQQFDNSFMKYNSDPKLKMHLQLITE